MSEQKVIALCGGRFALPTLQQLAFFRQLVVVAIPEHCEEMIDNTRHVLTGTGIPVVVLNKKTFEQDLIQAINIHGANTGLVLSFSYKIPPSVYLLPQNGFYNVHPGLLPGYRGPDPVFQQIRNKEEKAAVAIHKIDAGYDTGPVVVTEKIKLQRDDTHGILNEKLSYIAAKLTGTLLKLLSLDMAIPSRPQDESKARYYPKQTQSDVCINWQIMDATTIMALVNACNPWNKGAITKLNSKIIRIVEACLMEKKTTTELPGTIISIDEKGVLVSTINSQVICLQIIHIDEGFLLAKRIRQFGIKPGTRFSL